MHSSLIVYGKLFQLKSFPVQFKQTKKFRYAPDLTILIFNGMERDMEEDGNKHIQRNRTSCGSCKLKLSTIYCRRATKIRSNNKNVCYTITLQFLVVDVEPILYATLYSWVGSVPLHLF